MRIAVIFVLAITLVAAIAAIAAVAWRRPGRNPRVMPYSEARREIIGSIADPGAPSPSPPARPAGLDNRMPAHRLKELQALWPPTEINWRTYYDEYQQVVQSIRDELASIDPEHDWYELLSEPRRIVLIADQLESEINNGGFDQFFLNSSGDGAYAAPSSLRALGHTTAAGLAERANSQFPVGPPRHRPHRMAQMDDLPDSARETWSELDSEFYALDVPFGGIAAYFGSSYILDHTAEFFQPD